MFNELTMEEMQELNGGGNGTLFISCLMIAASPVIACLNPLAGLGFASAGVKFFISNLPNR